MGIFRKQGLCLLGIGIFLDVVHIALEDNLSAQASCIWTDVDEIVGCAHDFFVMFDHDNRIAETLEFLEHMNESVGVACMESDAGLIKDVETAYE